MATSRARKTTATQTNEDEANASDNDGDMPSWPVRGAKGLRAEHAAVGAALLLEHGDATERAERLSVWQARARAFAGGDTRQYKKAMFLWALELCGNASVACQASGTYEPTLYDWRKADYEFRQAWEEALAAGCEKLAGALEQKLYEHVMKGNITALIFALKGALPHKYKDRIANEHSGPNGTVIEIAAAAANVNPERLTTKDLERIAAAAAKQIKANNDTLNEKQHLDAIDV